MSPAARRAATRDIVLGILALVVAAVAVYYFVQHGSGQDAAPTDRSSWVFFTCGGCGEKFHLNGREMDTQYRKREIAQGPEKSVLFKCPKCGQPKALADDPQPPKP